MNAPDIDSKPAGLLRRHRLFVILILFSLHLLALAALLSFTFQGQRAILLLKARHGSPIMKEQVIKDLESKGPEYAPFIVELMNEYDYDEDHLVPNFGMSPRPGHEASQEYTQAEDRSKLLWNLIRKSKTRIISILFDYARQANYDIQYRSIQAIFHIVSEKAQQSFVFESQPQSPNNTKLPPCLLAINRTLHDYTFEKKLEKPEAIDKQLRKDYYAKVLSDLENWYKESKDYLALSSEQ